MSISTPIRYRHIYLLTALLIVIHVKPFMVRASESRGILELILLGALFAAAFTTASTRRQVIALSILGALAVTTQTGWIMNGSSLWLYGFLVCSLIFYAAVAFDLMKSLMKTTVGITADTICGAFAVYLILGLIWCMVYALLELTEPGSFTFRAGTDTLSTQFESFLGFSFTTLTTLGYGSIAPATPKADSLATLEAMVGQGYLAIVIARLVALQITQASLTAPSEEG